MERCQRRQVGEDICWQTAEIIVVQIEKGQGCQVGEVIGLQGRDIFAR